MNTPEIISTPLILGETIEARLSESGETNIYTFEGITGQRLYFDGLFGDFGIDARLLSPSGSNLFFSNVNGDRNPLSLSENGTYQLIVTGEFDNSMGGIDGEESAAAVVANNVADEGANIDNFGDNPGDYSFRLVDLATIETVSFETVIEGDLTPGRETDLFQFTGTKDQLLFFDGLGTQSGGSFLLFGPNNQFLNSANTRFDFETVLPSNGTYFFLVQGFVDSAFDYSFRIITPDTLSSTEITIGETIKGNIEEVGEKDTYTFSAEAGQRLFYDGLNGSSNIDVGLLSPSGINLFGFQNSNSDRAPVTLIESGTYQLIVDGSGATTGNYSFQLLDTGIATDLTLNTPTNGTLSPGNSTTLFQFEGTEEQRLVLDGQGSTGGGSIVIYAENNGSVTSRTIGFDREFSLPFNATYLLAVQGSNANDTVDFSFQLNSVELTTTPLTLGETISGNIDQPGNEDFYEFEGTVGQQLYFDGISGITSIDAQLLSPSGQSPFFRNVNDDFGSFTLIEDGTYRLRIDGSGTAIGDYSFRLVDTATAPKLNFGTILEGTLDPGTGSQVFTFLGNVNQSISLEDLGSNAFGGAFRLFGPGNQFIASSNFGFNFEVLLPGNGLFTLILDGARTLPVDYRFRVV